MQSTTVAVDLAKSVFQLAVADAHWRVTEQHRLTRSQFERWFLNRQVTYDMLGIAVPTLGFSIRHTFESTCEFLLQVPQIRVLWAVVAREVKVQAGACLSIE